MITTTLGPHDAPRAARRAVAECCATAGAGPVCTDNSALMTSEVVTNAIRHGSGPITFAVDCGGPVVRVEVGDDDEGRPTAGDADADSEGGRGMLIVDALASSWGVIETASGGKTVWFELSVRP